MGTKYSSQSITGYNASPPSDDGSQVEANKIKWATHKDKLSDPVKTLAESINTALVTYVDRQPTLKSVNYTTVASDHLKMIEATGTITITLGAVASMGAGYTVTVKNAGTGTITVEGSGSETIDGSLNVTLKPDDSIICIVDNSSGSYLIAGRNIEYVNALTSDAQTQLNAKQPLDSDLTAIAALANTNSNFIVGNGSTWVAETGSTARASLGLGSMATQNSSSVSITGGSMSGVPASFTSGTITGITDLAIADGGTGASTAAGALSNLGLTATAAEINKLDGATVTTAEINKLDGYTGNVNDFNILSGAAAAGLTAAELQYVKSLTSDAQTQITARLIKTSNLSDLSSASTARTNLGLGSIAVENTIGADNLDSATAGNYLEHAIEMSGADVDAAVSTSYVKILEIRIARAGTYRIRSSAIGTSVGSDNGYSQVYKNGVAYGTAQNGISRVTKNEDLSFAEGDLVQLYAKTQLASQEPDGPFYLMVMTGNPLVVTSTYSAQGYP